MARPRFVFSIGLALCLAAVVCFALLVTVMVREYTYYRPGEATVTATGLTTETGRDGRPLYIATVRLAYTADGKAINMPVRLLTRSAAEQQRWAATYSAGTVQKIGMARRDPHFIVLPEQDRVSVELRQAVALSGGFMLLALGMVYVGRKRRI